ncbi:ribonuclease H-like domain-containing protein [Tanacetum coccineum]|uniref:Ribonuclease H-like domain-containing protein n=1 Tax=Tanacetum coccineum TaxID=301880 RepID=A0ABQ5EHY2_9ASTR
MVVGEPSGSTVLINNLDAGNPLHVQNSDSSSSVLIPFKLLETKNYRIWNGAMKLALQARNKFGFVDGSCLKDYYASSDVLSAKWDRYNAMVLTWIMNVVSQDVYMGLVYYDNVASVWKELNETYDKVDGSFVYNLVQKINTVKHVCTCDVKCSCDASKELLLHQQLMKLIQFLMGLDDYYQSVRSALLTWDPFPDVKDAYTTVSREESYRGIPESSGVTESKMNATSFATKSFKNNRRNFNNNNNTRGPVNNSISRGPNPNLVCKNCGMIGHTIERCFMLIGYPPGFKKVSNPVKQSSFKQNFNANIDVKGNDKQQPACNTPSSFTADQMRKLLNLITDTPSRNIHTNMASRGTFFNGNVWFNIKLSRYYCANSSLVVKTITMGWIIDSRANQHLTVSTVGMYNVVDISSLKITIGHPNGTLATISHVRNLKISKNVILYDVLVVPVYCVSLLYVNKLIKDSKMFVGFDEDKCYIQDLKREITLGTGSESRGLYLFDMDNNKSIARLEVIRPYVTSPSSLMRYFAFGRHLEEFHVTWAHLEKKQTRLQTYTNITQDNVLSS